MADCNFNQGALFYRSREKRAKTMKLTASNITAAGNAIGFNASGQTIVASKKKKQGLTTIKVWLDINGTTQHVRNFGDVKSALAYVDTILDQAKTKELAWW